MSASAEVLGEDIKQANYLLPAGIAAAVGLSCVLGYLVFSNQEAAPTHSVSSTPVKTEAKVEPQSESRETKLDASQRVLNDAIASSRNIDTAYASILGLWGKVPYIGLTACQSAQQQGLSCFQEQGNWNSF